MNLRGNSQLIGSLNFKILYFTAMSANNCYDVLLVIDRIESTYGRY